MHQSGRRHGERKVRAPAAGIERQIRSSGERKIEQATRSVAPRLIDAAGRAGRAEAGGSDAKRTEKAFLHEIFPGSSGDLFQRGAHHHVVGTAVDRLRAGRQVWRVG